MSQIIHCAACRRMLQVRDEDLGKMVRCPSCGGAFMARTGNDEVTLAPGRVPDFELVNEAPPEPAPVRPPPPPPAGKGQRLSLGRALDPEGETYAVEFTAEDLLERPRRRRRRRVAYEPIDYDNVQPHRGTLIMILGILSIVLACIPLAGWALGGAAMSMGSTDARLMEQRVMDRSGESMTKIGQICGILGVFLATVAFIANLALAVSSLRH